MKVIHFSSTDFWEQGLIAYRIFRSIINQNIDGLFVTLMKHSGDSKVHSIIQDPVFRDKIKLVEKVSFNTPPPFFSILELWKQNLGIKLLTGEGDLCFSLPTTPINIGELKEIEEADIIHIHWAPGMIDYELAPVYFLGKPVVYTIYDSSIFTGGCHHITDCNEYKNECVNCPLVDEKAQELVAKSYKLKRKIYNLIDLHLVAQNSYMEEMAIKSNITSNITKIHPLTVPYFYLNKIHKKRAREILNVNQYSNIIVSVGFSFDEKKQNYLKHMLNALYQLLQSGEIESPYIILIGPGFENMDIESKLPYKVIPVVPNEEILSWYFAASDIFLAPYSEKDLSLFVLDAMAAGLPVFGSKEKNLTDFIDHGQNGYLANLEDEEDVKKGLLTIFNNSKKFSKHAKEKAKNNFSFEKQGEKYIQLYQDILKRKSKIDTSKYISWGEEIYQHKRHQLALNLFEKLIKFDDSNPDLLNNMGVIYWEKKELTKAIEHFERAYKLDPENPQIKENYENAKKLMAYKVNGGNQ